MTPPQIEVGSVVTESAASVRMTVLHVADGLAECVWFDSALHEHRDVFALADLLLEQRAPIDEQPFALAEAEAAGVLPEEDRRASEVPPSAPEEVITSPVVRDLSRAHERVPNDAGSFDYFTESGEKL